jgi:murein DD-endopeptidase MepM/ murein hydrolase activator NlpD
MSRRLWVVPAIVLVLVASSTAASADLEDELAEVEDGIATINRQIEQQGTARTQLQRDLGAAEVRLTIVRGELSAANDAVEAGIVRIVGGQAEATRIQEALEQAAIELATTRLSIAQTGDELTKRAVDSYMSHSTEVPLGFFDVSSVTDVLIGAEYASQTIESTERAIRDLEALKATEQAQRVQVEAQQARHGQVLEDLARNQTALEEAQLEAEKRSAAVGAEVQEYADLLAAVLRLINEMDHELSALEDDAAQLEQDILAAEINSDPTGSGFLWPVNGVVTSPYGFRIHPITGARRLHSGIDIGAPNGRTIVASRSGTVILARYYGGYGNAVVISHGGGLTTLYAHMSSDAVSSGQFLSAGDTVGYIGSTGFSTGNHLHFETREYGIPVDPMNYLGG